MKWRDLSPVGVWVKRADCGCGGIWGELGEFGMKRGDLGVQERFLGSNLGVLVDPREILGVSVGDLAVKVEHFGVKRGDSCVQGGLGSETGRFLGLPEQILE